MTDLEQKIAILRQREERLEAAHVGLKSLGEQRLEAIRAGDNDKAKAMDVPLASHRGTSNGFPA